MQFVVLNVKKVVLNTIFLQNSNTLKLQQRKKKLLINREKNNPVKLRLKNQRKASSIYILYT